MKLKPTQHHGFGVDPAHFLVILLRYKGLKPQQSIMLGHFALKHGTSLDIRHEELSQMGCQSLNEVMLKISIFTAGSLPALWISFLEGLKTCHPPNHMVGHRPPAVLLEPSSLGMMV